VQGHFLHEDYSLLENEREEEGPVDQLTGMVSNAFKTFLN